MAFEKVSSIIDEWKFQNSGDEVIGTLERIKTDVGANKATIYIIKTEAGKLISVWETTVLSGKMAHINIGDKIKIVYLGRVKNYHNFEVYKDNGKD